MSQKKHVKHDTGPGADLLGESATRNRTTLRGHVVQALLLPPGLGMPRSSWWMPASQSRLNRAFAGGGVSGNEDHRDLSPSQQVPPALVHICLNGFSPCRSAWCLL